MIYDELGQLIPVPLQHAAGVISHHAEELAKRALDEFGATRVEHKALQTEIAGAVATAFNMARLLDLAKGTAEDEGVALNP